MRLKLLRTRPYTLEEGKKYLQREVRRSGESFSFCPVVFISYASCPAFVIVQDGDGKRRRCPRDEIFISADGQGHRPPHAGLPPGTAPTISSSSILNIHMVINTIASMATTTPITWRLAMCSLAISQARMAVTAG